MQTAAVQLVPKNKSYVRVTPVSNSLLFLDRIHIYVCLLLFQIAGMLTVSLHKLLLSLLYERELKNSFACRFSRLVLAECWIGAMFSHSFFSWNKLQTYVLLRIKILYQYVITVEQFSDSLNFTLQNGFIIIYFGLQSLVL